MSNSYLQQQVLYYSVNLEDRFNSPYNPQTHGKNNNHSNHSHNGGGNHLNRSGNNGDRNAGGGGGSGNSKQNQGSPQTPNTNNSSSSNHKYNDLWDSTDVTHSCLETQPLNQHLSQLNISVDHLDLRVFKLNPCSINNQHNHKQCPFYHNAKDRKRPNNSYSADLCQNMEKFQTCELGDNCKYAHNRVEQLYQQDKYKTKFCTYYPYNLMNCDYGIFCSFAHSQCDISIQLIHNMEYDDDFYIFFFQTVWCPFNLTQHDQALCVYAHNWQDYRRKPNLVSYQALACPNWKATDFIGNYEDGCTNQFLCTYCHGWKELEYHPQNYKTKVCTSGKNCTKGRDCPNFHNPKDQRIISNLINQQFFKMVPRNRVINNTFQIRVGNGNKNNFQHIQFLQTQQQFYNQVPLNTQFLPVNGYLSSSGYLNAPHSEVIDEENIETDKNEENNWLNASPKLNSSFEVDNDDKKVTQINNGRGNGKNPLSSSNNEEFRSQLKRSYQQGDFKEFNPINQRKRSSSYNELQSTKTTESVQDNNIKNMFDEIAGDISPTLKKEFIGGDIQRNDIYIKVLDDQLGEMLQSAENSTKREEIDRKNKKFCYQKPKILYLKQENMKFILNSLEDL